IIDTGGGNVAMGMCETLGADEVGFGVVVAGMVDVAGATEVADVVFIEDIGPSCETIGGKVDAGNTEPDGDDAGVGERVGGIDM
ncbi:hypothetical protein KI387_019331, partial [Taxus chinensis]